jgi:hypothetical protein
MTAVTMPKAAQQILDECSEHPYIEAKVTTHDSVGVTLTLTSTTGRTVSITWTAGSFHDGPVNSRLGFHTTPGRDGVRFDYVSAHNPNPYRPQDRYPNLRSVRQARGFIGLPI